MTDSTESKTDNDADRRKSASPIAEREDLVAGRNAVSELLKSGKTIDKLYILRGRKEGALAAVFAEARARGVPVAETDRAALDRLAPFNQGVVARIPPRDYASVDDILRNARDRGEEPFVVIADRVSDPQNLGALLRTAECAGCHGAIIPKHRAASLTAAVVKASAGACEHLPVCKAPNIASVLRYLKEKGVWIYALEADGVPYDTLDYKGGAAFVLGSEGEGLSRLVRESSDFVVSIPLHGRLNSLNVSAAAAIVLFEAAKSRRAGGGAAAKSRV